MSSLDRDYNISNLTDNLQGIFRKSKYCTPEDMTEKKTLFCFRGKFRRLPPLFPCFNSLRNCASILSLLFAQGFLIVICSLLQ